MIIKRIVIENYLCYYGSNVFEFSEGLNIILGENGEGKTKFFEAVEWLLNGDSSGLALLVSAKRLHEAEVGESFLVKVSMVVEQFDRNATIAKSFLVRKDSENEFNTSNYSIEGIEENQQGERIQVDGRILLDQVFPFQIREYSMFKGEAELNLFKGETALTNLINLFSDARHYEKYCERIAFLRDRAERAVEDSSRLNKKNEQLYRKLEADINELQREKERLEILLNATEQEVLNLEANIQDAERHVNNAESLDTVNKRIKTLEERISSLSSKIDENYTTALFDNRWILVNFEAIQSEFVKKIADHSKERRALQTEFDKQIGIREGEKRAKAAMLKNTIPLPLGVPSKVHMEEMLKEEFCKVCNREAPKDSEPYRFMLARLTEYLNSQEKEENDAPANEVLFIKNYTNRLENLSIIHEDNLKKLREIRSDIKEHFEFNRDRKLDISELKQKLELEQNERDKVLGNSTLAEENLMSVMKNYTAWQRDLKIKNNDEIIYSARLREVQNSLVEKRNEKDNLDLSSGPVSLVHNRNILRDIETIFIETKKRKFNEFIVKLQERSNHFFKSINVDSFTGTIVLKPKTRNNAPVIDVELQESGQPFFRPSQSLSTSMHISILFAISQLASEIKLENFPMIFDAPTSSFGENKTTQFLNLISATSNQKILLIKDFLYYDNQTKSLAIKKEFDGVKRDKAFWVKLERPFDPNSLKTINSQVINL